MFKLSFLKEEKILTGSEMKFYGIWAWLQSDIVQFQILPREYQENIICQRGQIFSDI